MNSEPMTFESQAKTTPDGSYDATADTRDKDDFEAIAAMQAEDEARRSITAQLTEEPSYSITGTETNQGPEESKIRRNTKIVAGVGAGVTLAAAAAAGLMGMQGGSENGDQRGVEVEGPATVELNEVANLRYDPDARTGENYNGVLKLDEPVTISVEDDLRRLDNTNNGTWYGIPVEAVNEAVPDADLSKDKDGVVWVNEQGVSSIETPEGTQQ